MSTTNIFTEREVTASNESEALFPDNTTSTVLNTGLAERGLTGVNESELWLDSESSSTVLNTGINERGLSGSQAGDDLFDDQSSGSTSSTVSIRVIIDGVEQTLIVDLLKALQTRSAYYENEVGTTTILQNLNNCE